MNGFGVPYSSMSILNLKGSPRTDGKKVFSSVWVDGYLPAHELKKVQPASSRLRDGNGYRDVCLRIGRDAGDREACSG